MEKRNKNKKSGFTLVELVVVIAIIGILAAVITPRVKNATLKAKDAKAVATLDGLRTAVNVYHAETGWVPTNPGTATAPGNLVAADITALKGAGYLDSTGGLDTTKSPIEIEVGVKQAAPTGCTAGTPASGSTGNKTVGIVVVEGLSLKFNDSTNGDINCKVWSDK